MTTYANIPTYLFNWYDNDWKSLEYWIYSVLLLSSNRHIPSKNLMNLIYFATFNWRPDNIFVGFKNFHIFFLYLILLKNF